MGDAVWGTQDGEGAQHLKWDLGCMRSLRDNPYSCTLLVLACQYGGVNLFLVYLLIILSSPECVFCFLE